MIIFLQKVANDLFQTHGKNGLSRGNEGRN